jgi:putative thioredoxin
MAAPIDVTDATFQSDVVQRSSTVPVVVDLWAEWCGPCRTLGPVLDKVIGATDGQVELAKVDIDANPGVAQAFKVQSIPAVYAMKDGKVVDGFMGAQPEWQVAEFVQRLLPNAVESEVDRLIAAGDEESLRQALARTGGAPSDTADLAERLDALLDTVKGDDDARQEFVDLLELLDDDDATAVWRRKLAARLF